MQHSDRPATANVSRRTLAKGAAWSAPAVMIAAAAPASAASRPIQGCYTLTWTTGGFQTLTSGTQGVDGVRSGTLSPAATSPGTGSLTGTVTQNRTAGVALGRDSTNRYAPSNTVGDFAVGNSAWSVSGGSVWSIARPSTTGLVLAQARDAGTLPSQTVTFSFGGLVDTARFRIYDLTAQDSTQNSQRANNYYDTFVFSGGTATWTASGTTTRPGLTTGQPLKRTGDARSNVDPSRNADVTISGINSDTFSFTYYNELNNTGGSARGDNNQFIVIGDVTVCGPA